MTPQWPHPLVWIHAGADTGFSEGGGGGEGQGGPLRGVGVGGEGQGGPLRGGGVIAPVGEKLLFEHKTNSATRGGGGGDLPCHPPPPRIRH